MRHFIFKTTKFIGIIILCLFAEFAICIWIVSQINDYKHLADNKNILIIGDSNTQCALNDSILTNCKNFSRGGHSNFYTYIKLKELLNYNKNIDTVLLSFSPHNVVSEIERDWLFDRKNMQTIMPYYISKMERPEFKCLIKNDPKNFIASFPNGCAQLILKHLKGIDLNERYGKFHAKKTNNLEEALREMETFDTTNLSNQPALVEISYIRKINNLCLENGIKLILINTPKIEERLNHIEYRVELYYKFYNSFLSDITLWDFSEMKMPRDEFYDTVHLNMKGANHFSTFLYNAKTETINKYTYNLK